MSHLHRAVVLIIFGISLFGISSSAQQTNYFMPSPKLNSLLSANAGARHTWSNECARAFSGRTVGLYYFYDQSESIPRAYHFYPYTAGKPAVVICVRENQEPWDEFISVLFELINSKNESRFGEFVDKAKAGTITRNDFVTGILRLEFEAVKKTSDLVRGFNLTNDEKQRSYYYRRFQDCPNDFDAFLTYSKKVSTHRDPITEYEAQYDAFRKSSHDGQQSP